MLANLKYKLDRHATIINVINKHFKYAPSSGSIIKLLPKIENDLEQQAITISLNEITNILTLITGNTKI